MQGVPESLARVCGVFGGDGKVIRSNCPDAPSRREGMYSRPPLNCEPQAEAHEDPGVLTLARVRDWAGRRLSLLELAYRECPNPNFRIEDHSARGSQGPRSGLC